MKTLLIIFLTGLSVNNYSQTVFSSNYYQVIGKNDSLSMTFTPHANFVNGFNVMGAVVNRQTIIALDTFKDVNFSNNIFTEKLFVCNSVFSGHINMQHVIMEKGMSFEDCKLDLCNFLASNFKNFVSFKNTVFGGDLNIDYSQFYSSVDFTNAILPDTITAVDIYSASVIDLTVSNFKDRKTPVTLIIDKGHLTYFKIDEHFKVINPK